MPTNLMKARAYEIAADWHDTQARTFRVMSEDFPRIDEATCARAGDASRHHFGSAAALRLAASNLRRTALKEASSHAD